MKKLCVSLGVMASIVFTGCAAMVNQTMYPPVKIAKEDIVVSSIDYSKLEADGFSVSSAVYAGKYKELGYVSALYMPEAHYKEYPIPSTEEPYSSLEKGEWIMGGINLQKALDSTCAKVKSMGGDGIMNLKIDREAKNYNMGSPYASTSLYVLVLGYRISGVAIKRE